MKQLTIPFLIAAFATSACSKDDSSSGSSSAKATGGALVAITLDKLGIDADVPKGANQSEMLGDILVQAPGYVFSVRKAKDTDPKSIAEEKEGAEMFSPKSSSDEKLADGYVFQFENKGSMGANHFVHVRRTVGGVDYYCSTTAPDKKMAANAVAACKSLRK